MDFSDAAQAAGLEAKPFYSIPEIAATLRVSEYSVRKAMERGELRFKQIGRKYSRPEWVDEWIED